MIEERITINYLYFFKYDGNMSSPNMLSTSELTVRLRKLCETELRPKVIDIIDGSELRRRVQAEDISSKEVIEINHALGAYCDEVTELAKKSELFWFLVDKMTDPSHPFPENLLKDPEYPTELALSLINHDMGGESDKLWEGIEEAVSSSQSLGSSKVLGRFLGNKVVARYEYLRIALCVMAYIAFGGQEYILPVKKDILPDIIMKRFEPVFAGGTPRNIYIDLPPDESIRSDIVWALLQCVKNADGSSVFYHHGKNTIPRIISSLERENDALTAHIIDNGPGIDQGILPKVLGIYTTCRTGIGLQVVSKLAERSGGNIVIASTTAGNYSFLYSPSKSGEVLRLDEMLSRGTMFSLTFLDHF